MPDGFSLLTWLQQHYIELIAVISGLLYVVFTIREKILLWLFGIVSSGLYVYIFFSSGIFAFACLYMYYVVIGFYGWYNWARKPTGADGQTHHLPVRRSSSQYLRNSILVTIVLIIPLYYILREFTSSDMALADAILTAGGMVATWMLTQKLIEQWIFWIMLDMLSTGVMVYKGLYPSALLFLVYTMLAIKGFLTWKKDLNIQQAG